MKTDIMEVTINKRAADRAIQLVNEPVLSQGAENIFVNAPVAIHQIAFQNELNGILLGMGAPTLRVIKLPILKEEKKLILKVMNGIAKL